MLSSDKLQYCVNYSNPAHRKNTLHYHFAFWSFRVQILVRGPAVTIKEVRQMPEKCLNYTETSLM